MTDFAARDLMVVWPVESLSVSGLRYPLQPLPFDDAADAAHCYYEIQLHFGNDFIYHTSDTVDPFEPSPMCARDHTLEYYPESDEDPFYASRLSATCPECGATFDPTNLVAAGRDGWTGEDVRRQGGATYRFAFVVDCGKFFGSRGLCFHPELKALAKHTLGVQTYEVEDFY